MDTNTFAWLVYGLAIIVFIVEGLLYTLYTSLLPTALRVGVTSAPDEPVEYDVRDVKRLLFRHVLRSLAPFLVASLVWTLWIAVFLIDKDSDLVDGVLALATGLLFGCFVLFAFSYAAVRRIRESNVHTDV